MGSKSDTATQRRHWLLDVYPRDAFATSSAKPLRTLLVHREDQEVRTSDGQLVSASILVRCRTHGTSRWQQLMDFGGSYNGRDVRLSNGGVFVDPAELRGHRIGTYLMNQVVGWAKQWPHTPVRAVRLLSLQASEDNKHRRNRLYEKFGLVFDYNDPAQRSGSSRPLKASELRESTSWEQNIRERAAPSDAACDAL